MSESPAQTRAQDAIVSILASMNNQNLENNVSSNGPVNYSHTVPEVDEVVSLEAHNFEQERQEMLPLNLATTSPSQVGTLPYLLTWGILGE